MGKNNLLIFVKTAGVLSFLFLMSFSPVSSQIIYSSGYPINSTEYWTKPTMSMSEVKNLSKHDFLIIDLENKFNNYHVLQALKKANPTIKLICYSNPMEIFLTKYPSRPWQNKVIDELTQVRPQWLLKTVTAIRPQKMNFWQRLLAFFFRKPKFQEQYATFWPGMIMINMSSTCPPVNEETYSDWMAKKLSTEILSDPIWDGYFMDNGTVNISWTHPEKIDINGDRKPDRDMVVDHRWKQGVENYLLKIRNYRSNLIMMSNKGDVNLLNIKGIRVIVGKFFEKFPNDYLGDKWAGGWLQCLQNAGKSGPYTVFQANRSNIKFVLASALLLDNVYVCVSQDDSGYFPELELETGRALGKYVRKGRIFYREYENVNIMVDPLNMFAEITPRK